MGGNLQINTFYAQRLPVKDKEFRSNLIKDFNIFLNLLNKTYESKYKTKIWNSNFIKYKKIILGSGKYVLNPKIKDIGKYKQYMGDIDILTPISVKDNLIELLKNIKQIHNFIYLGGKSIIGRNTSFSTLFKYNNYIVQMDFIFSENMKSPDKLDQFQVFSHSSDLLDLKFKVKGVFHKYLIGSLDFRRLKEYYILKKNNEIIIKKSHPFSFSVKKGIRLKIKPATDENGNIIKYKNNIVFRELKPSETNYETDIFTIFYILFNVYPTKSDLKNFNSFVGLLKLIKKYFSEIEIENVLYEFFNRLFSKNAQLLYRDNYKEDFEKKIIPTKLIKNQFPNFWNKYKNDILNNMKNYYKTLNFELIQQELNENFILKSSKLRMSHITALYERLFMEILNGKKKEEDIEKSELDKNWKDALEKSISVIKDFFKKNNLNINEYIFARKDDVKNKKSIDFLKNNFRKLNKTNFKLDKFTPADLICIRKDINFNKITFNNFSDFRNYLLNLIENKDIILVSLKIGNIKHLKLLHPDKKFNFILENKEDIKYKPNNKTMTISFKEFTINIRSASESDVTKFRIEVKDIYNKKSQSGNTTIKHLIEELKKLNLNNILHNIKRKETLIKIINNYKEYTDNLKLFFFITNFKRISNYKKFKPSEKFNEKYGLKYANYIKYKNELKKDDNKNYKEKIKFYSEFFDINENKINKFIEEKINPLLNLFIELQNYLGGKFKSENLDYLLNYISKSLKNLTEINALLLNNSIYTIFKELFETDKEKLLNILEKIFKIAYSVIPDFSLPTYKTVEVLKNYNRDKITNFFNSLLNEEFKKYILITGRFQPISKKHIEMINDIYKKYKLPIIIGIVTGKKSSQDKDRNPFSFELRKEIFENCLNIDYKIFNFPNAYLPDIINELKNKNIEIIKFICGKDREDGYKRQLKDSGIEIIVYQRKSDDISSTKIRNAIKNNNFEEFKKLTPKCEHKYFKIFQKILK